MSEEKEWKKLIRQWKRDYRDKIPKKKVDFSGVTAVRVCQWCGQTDGDIHRHHKGNDFTFAKLYPDEFAARYIQFLEEDTVMLCQPCHLDVHWWCGPIMTEFFQRRDQLVVQNAPDEDIIALCKEYRKRCIEMTEDVMKTEPRGGEHEQF